MPRSGAEVARAELIGGNDLGGGLGRLMERGHGGRRGESVPFSSLTSPALPISLCSSALAPAGGARSAGGTPRSVCGIRPDRQTPYRERYRIMKSEVSGF